MSNASGPSPRAGVRKLPARYAGIVTPFILSILMSSIVSLISTLHAFGPESGFVHVWFGAWEISWIVAFPALLLLLPIVRRLTTFVVESGPSGHR